MKKLYLFVMLMAVCMVASATSVKFNDSWKFQLGDFPDAKNVSFDDSSWRKLSVPHDWAFEGGYSVHGAQKDKGGYAMGGIGWYRKEFTIKANQLKGNKIFIDFEGVYMNSEVWINGSYLGKRPYGYISFSYELTSKLKEGKNTISVRVDNSLEPSARWYHGCGIYSDVYLRTNGAGYFEKDGTFLTTPQITAASGKVAISTEVVAKAQKGAMVELSIKDGKGKVVASNSLKNISLKEGLQSFDIAASVAKPALWSPTKPSLYRATLTLKDSKGKVLDRNEVRFGFRTIKWSAANGFHLNGKQLKLQGVCEHMEGGPIGGIKSDVVLRWRLQQLKDMGCNAVRTAHNPYWPAFYHLCDEIGLLVMDELFDGWKQKADHDYGAQAFDKWWKRDLEAWIRRDRNHPSIFMYSVGNETHGDIAPQLVAACHKFDSTRLVTSGDCNPDDMDVYGVNGRSEKFSFINSWKADTKPFIATENPHTWQVRGYYRSQTWYRDGFPNTKQEPQYVPNLTEKEIFGYDWISPSKRRTRKQIFNPSYDNGFVRVTARHLIEVLRDKPWFSGSFRWTGYDYLGEAGYVHGGWPFRAFQSGALDLAGFKKDLYFLYQSQWTTKKMAHILPHWTHPKMKLGEKVPVWVYTNYDEVELFINKRSLGVQKPGKKWDEMQCEWLVPYEPGLLEVKVVKNGKKVTVASQQTATEPIKLGVSKYEERELKADGEDVAILTVTAQDKLSIHYPYGENRLYTKIFGGAKMLSFESGSPVDVETNYNATDKEFFFGLNRMFIQSSDKNKSKAVSVMLGSILGDKKLMTSSKVSIYFKEVALRGTLPSRNLAVRYTTDGSTPTYDSKRYWGSFSVESGTTVKAVLFENMKPIMSMEEKFGENEGLYWGTPGEKVCEFDGEQAELAKLGGGAYFFKKDGDSFFGDGYVKFRKKGGSITWYQENDGGPFTASISFRYSQQTPDGSKTRMQLWNNDKLVKVIEFRNTGSSAAHWSEFAHNIKINSGGNNIKLVSITSQAPSLDQMTMIQ